MALKLYFTQTEHEDQVWGSEGSDWAATMRDQMLRSADARYEMIDRPERADIIIFWEPHQDSQVVWIPRLRAHPLVREFPNRVFVVSDEDWPLGLLSGLYTSLPARRHHAHRHRAWLYYQTQNRHLEARRASRPVSAPPNLAVFWGANSHPLRGRLFEQADVLARQGILTKATQLHQFANPHDPQLKPLQLAYIDAILDAKFSLCPMGNATGSHRLQESMALGRAPVIISDDWVPVADLVWERFAVFVAEKDLHYLPSILREHEARWQEMGDLALQVYESRFSQGVFAARAVEQIVAIYEARTHDERDFFSQWDRIIEDEGLRSLRQADEVTVARAQDERLDLAAFPGTWTSSDPGTRGVARLDLAVHDGELVGRIWGGGANGPVDWGPRRAEALYADAVTSRAGAGFLLRYDHGFLTSHVEANLKLGVAVLGVYQSFQDASRRHDYFFREFLSADDGAGEMAPAPAVAAASCGLDEELGRGPGAAEERLLGHWHNTHHGSLGIPEIALERRGERVTVRVWGAGAYGLVDWGEAPGELFTCIEEDGVRSAAALARYDFGFMACELQIRQNKGILAVTTFNRFRDGSGRSSYVTRELFYRGQGGDG